MAIFEILGGPITHRYLMKKTKSELAYMYLAALKGLQTERGWQPIETAPKDGSDILVYDSEDKQTVMVFYGDSASGFGRRYGKAAMAFCVSGSFNDSMGGFDTVDAPTHWMPLPEPPEGDNHE